MGDTPSISTTSTASGLPAQGTDPDSALSQLEHFSEVIAHELRTPLTVVRGASQTIMERYEELDASELKRLVGMIDRNSRLATLLLGRLGLARDVEQGEVELSTEGVDLTELVRDSVSDLADVVLGEHETSVSAPDQIVVDGDATALREIVFNLLSNAAKYSRRDAEIEVAVVRDGDAVSVVVRNHGSGVTPPDTERIFEPYVQGDPGSPGVGLGLFISRGLARAHGGDLTVRPAADEGSEFILVLPVDGPADRPLAPEIQTLIGPSANA